MKLILLAQLLSVSTLNALAAQTSGIYLTVADYETRQLKSEGQCGSENHQLDIHDIRNKSYIHVKHGADTIRYEKSNLFGFHGCDGRDYRFVSNQEYEILEAKELYIYGHTVAGGGRRVLDLYSFSKRSSGPISPLTLDNLESAFPDDLAFRNRLRQAFGHGKDAAQYDRQHKMFKVNWLLTGTIPPEHR